MGTKNISITEEAYSRLASFRKGAESFSEIINRLTRKRALLRFGGVLSNEAGHRLEARIREKRRALDAITALDRSEWPQAARDAVPELAAIDLEDDEDTKEGVFSLRFESASDPEAEYYVDFRNGGVEGADRLA